MMVESRRSPKKLLPQKTPKTGIKKVTETALVASTFEMSSKKMINAKPVQMKPNSSVAFHAAIEMLFSGQKKKANGRPAIAA